MPNDTLPLVSVVTPTRNRLEALELCRRWVARQKYPKVEHVVVEDPGEGLHKTLHRGFSEAKGDILTFLADDDWIGPDYIQTSVAYLASMDLMGHAVRQVYHLGSMRYGKWSRGPFSGTISFRRKLLGHALELLSPPNVKQPKKLLRRHAYLVYKPGDRCVFMRGIYPEPHHKLNLAKYPFVDPDGQQLREWIGDEDAETYLDLRARLSNQRD